MKRRTFALFAAACSAALLSACSALTPSATPASLPPIVFVHGNGDSAALWQTTLWRFESNGWPRERLYAINVPYPQSRDDDSKAQPGRTSAAENMAFLKSEVDKVLQATGAGKVVLFGNSRGGNAIRSYIYDGGGASKVSHAILGGTPNHGVWAIKGFREGNEFAGTGPYLSALNAPKNAAGDEVSGPVQWLTIRSDNNDKFAQPDGVWIGAKGTATNITYAGPELKGALNVVIPSIDHRETAYSPAAFAASYRFITGKPPSNSTIAHETSIVLNGLVTGQGANSNDPNSGTAFNNMPITGSSIAVYAIDSVAGTRLGSAVHSRSIGADGVWGPVQAKAGQAYEFEVTAPGYATTHIYRNAFPRSSSIVHLRAERLAEADKKAAAVVSFTRPRGYFDLARDTMRFDGISPPPGLPATGAGLAVSKIAYPSMPERAIEATFNGEQLTGRAWPASEGHVSILELQQ